MYILALDISMNREAQAAAKRARTPAHKQRESTLNTLIVRRKEG